MKLKSKITTLDISKYILFLLIVSINIREPFFHTREILYVLTILSSMMFMDISKTKYTAILITIWAFCVSINLIIPGSNIDFGSGGFETIIISAYLLLMCFYQERYAKTIMDAYAFVSVVVALIVVTIWIACFLSDSTFSSLRSFFIDLEKSTGLSLINIDKRMILGTRYLAVWYRTAPCMTCAMGYHLARRLNGKKKNLHVIVLMFAALIFTGTRANIISAMLLLGFYIGFKMYKKGLKIMPIVLFAVIMIIAIVFVIRFINDSNSQSSAIKVLDTMTYFDIYKQDPIRALLFGYGPGSTFFSRGRQMYVNVTENSLLETIRRYGLVSTCSIIFGIWLTPLRSPGFRKKKNYTKYFYYCVFGSYMLSALTNPYLLDSVGFCALLYFCIIFSYGTEIEMDDGEAKRVRLL